MYKGLLCQRSIMFTICFICIISTQFESSFRWFFSPSSDGHKNCTAQTYTPSMDLGPSTSALYSCYPSRLASQLCSLPSAYCLPITTWKHSASAGQLMMMILSSVPTEELTEVWQRLQRLQLQRLDHSREQHIVDHVETVEELVCVLALAGPRMVRVRRLTNDRAGPNEGRPVRGLWLIQSLLHRGYSLNLWYTRVRILDPKMYPEKKSKVKLSKFAWQHKESHTVRLDSWAQLRV